MWIRNLILIFSYLWFWQWMGSLGYVCHCTSLICCSFLEVLAGKWPCKCHPCYQCSWSQLLKDPQLPNPSHLSHWVKSITSIVLCIFPILWLKLQRVNCSFRCLGPSWKIFRSSNMVFFLNISIINSSSYLIMGINFWHADWSGKMNSMFYKHPILTL